jgi:NDP-sugar pyrophosphorylase family protein
MNIQAVILAGGRGTRLQSVVSDRPKALAQVAGIPFLDLLFGRLVTEGVRQFVVCTGFGAAAIQNHLGDGAAFGIDLEYSHETSPLGTGGAVRNAMAHLRSDPVLVLNADSWCSYHLQEFLAFHHMTSSRGSIVLAKVEDRDRFGSVSVDPDGRITAFEEKRTERGEGWINAGIYALSLSVIADIPAGRPVSLETEVFPQMIGRGLSGWTGGRDLIDIGTPESFLVAQDVFRRITRERTGP